MTQETQTPQAAAVQRGDAPTLALEPGELTAAALTRVVGGDNTGPGTPGDKTSSR